MAKRTFFLGLARVFRFGGTNGRAEKESAGKDSSDDENLKNPAHIVERQSPDTDFNIQSNGNAGASYDCPYGIILLAPTFCGDF